MSTGYNFIPHSAYASVGYEFNRFAVEGLVMSMGKEEPNTKPGPEVTLDVLAYAPSWPIFVKAGIVTGGGGKNGYNLGVGVDFPLVDHWSLRTQVTYFHVKEDIGEPAEGEKLVSVGLKYQF